MNASQRTAKRSLFVVVIRFLLSSCSAVYSDFRYSTRSLFSGAVNPSTMKVS
jgi:hypothetical protein